MPIWEFSGLVFLVSASAGFLGALTGLGGGVVITPVLTLLFRVDMRYAIGATLVSVIATSSGAAAAYVREGFSNIRIGMFLEIATTVGAVMGALLSSKIPTGALAVIFGLVLLHAAYLTSRSHPEPHLRQQTDLNTTGKLKPRKFDEKASRDDFYLWTSLRSFYMTCLLYTSDAADE